MVKDRDSLTIRSRKSRHSTRIILNKNVPTTFIPPKVTYISRIMP